MDDSCNKNSNNDLDALYDRLRKQIEHEDNLTNQRLSWFLGFQGLFIVAYGTILSSDCSKHYTTVLFILSFVAFVTCCSAAISLDAASKSINELSSFWNAKTRLPYVKRNHQEQYFPQLLYIGGSVYKFGQDLYVVIMMLAWIGLSITLLLKSKEIHSIFFYLGTCVISFYLVLLMVTIYTFIFKQK